MSTPAPVKQVSGKTIALVAAAIAAVGALIIGLIVGLSSTDEAGSGSRVTLAHDNLPYSATMTVRVPGGWKLLQREDAGYFMLVPSNGVAEFAELERIRNSYLTGEPLRPDYEIVTVQLSRCDIYAHLGFDADAPGWQTVQMTEEISYRLFGDHPFRITTAVRTDENASGICLVAVGTAIATDEARLSDGPDQVVQQIIDDQVIHDLRFRSNADATVRPSPSR